MGKTSAIPRICAIEYEYELRRKKRRPWRQLGDDETATWRRGYGADKVTSAEAAASLHSAAVATSGARKGAGFDSSSSTSAKIDRVAVGGDDDRDFRELRCADDKSETDQRK